MASVLVDLHAASIGPACPARRKANRCKTSSVNRIGKQSFKERAMKRAGQPSNRIRDAIAALDDVDPLRVFGRVAAVRGLLVEIAGPIAAMQVGGRLDIQIDAGGEIACEIIGFSGDRALAMPFGSLQGVRRGCEARVSTSAAGVRPSAAWLGRVVDALGRPLDGKGRLPAGPSLYPFRAEPPAAHSRRRVGAPLDLGIRAINTFLTAARGQRMGIFAGSGVGKSVLLSMMARATEADVAVIGLVGERGREVQEFLQDDLGPEGLARAVVVVATSDEPAYAPQRRLPDPRDLGVLPRSGTRVLCMMDSVTRFAMAQRDIGLAAGEPPTAKGYTPTVFSELRVSSNALARARRKAR
jgi:flagellum-specific ATP synthase